MARFKGRADLRRRIYEILELGTFGDWTSILVSRLIVALIILNLVTITLESVPELSARYGLFFTAVETVSIVVFTVEYLLRLWVAVEHAPYGHLAGRRARIRYALSLAGVVDLLAVLPFWIALVFPIDLRILLVFRIVRFLKLARYSPAMRSLFDVLSRERRALSGCFLILIGVALVAAAVMYHVEREAQPDKFGTIPDAMWWAIVTLGTVGYGDVVPITPFGRLVATFTIFSGIVVLALPIGIIATAFAEEIHRREFVVTWTMVARVPLFAELNAIEIADVMRLLRSQTVDAGATIVRRGDPGHSMYFVANGEVEIELKDSKIKLGVGDFFGEIALLRQTRRTATVKALTRTSLLVLDAQDLRALMERSPRIAARLKDMASKRLGGAQITPEGDIVAQELAEGVVEEGAPVREKPARKPKKAED
jgi:voltage-gated potassium channel